MLEFRRRGLSRALESLLPVLFLALSSCALPGGPPIGEIAPEINASLVRGKFALGPGDQIQVTWPDVAEVGRNQLTTVRTDGWASFNGLDDVQVAGLTLEQLDERLTQAYARVFSDANLTLQLVLPGHRYVTVMGEVTTQGQVPIENDGRLTLVEAIGKAGGYDKYTAHMSSTVLVRWDAKEQRQVAWKIDARPKFWEQGDPIFLQPYDLVFIPNTPIDDVGIWVDMYIRRMIPFPRIFVN
jgi:protein involved in polysaccharide export with SLBB domain